MLSKRLIQLSMVVIILVASNGFTGTAQAGGFCGNTYVVQWGDSLSKIAALCGTTVSALYASNPGIGPYLYAGQVLVIPGGIPPYYPPSGYNSTYIVKPGDTFAGIARMFGVSVNQLWAANPHIWNINRIYTGQVINVPWFDVNPKPSEELIPLSYGTVPAGTPYGKVKLVNKANAEVYVSLQGTTADGFEVINEYPVSGIMGVKVPSGKYTYVAWVGGRKMVGYFGLSKSGDRTITFFKDRIIVE